MRIDCEFCQGGGFIEDEYGYWKLQAVKLTPMIPVVLSGHSDLVPPNADPPYYALFLRYLDEGYDKGEHASFPIKFCPVCGRDLRPPKKPLTPEEWVRKERERRKQPGYEEAKKAQQELFTRIDEFGKDCKVNEDGSIEVNWKPEEKGHD